MSFWSSMAELPFQQQASVPRSNAAFGEEVVGVSFEQPLAADLRVLCKGLWCLDPSG